MPMSVTSSQRKWFRVALVALPLALGGCDMLDNLNPLQERKTPLPGERRPVFPGGVPGVEYNAPPTQPTNSNVAIPQGPAGLNDPNQPAVNAPNAPAAANNPNEDPWAARR
jgi:hypothetical protein